MFTPLSTWAGNAFARRGTNEYLIEGGTMALNFITEFLYQRLIVYRHNVDNNGLARKKAGKDARIPACGGGEKTDAGTGPEA